MHILIWIICFTERVKLDKDLLSSIFKKAHNDKLFKRLQEPLELIRHAKSKCHTWFNTNLKSLEKTQTQNIKALCLQYICLVDGSWTSDL